MMATVMSIGSPTVKDASFRSIAFDVIHVHRNVGVSWSAQISVAVNYAARKPKASADDDGSVVVVACLRGNQFTLYEKT